MQRSLPIVLSAILVASSALAADPAREAAEQYRMAHEKEIVGDFVDLLSLPNVATTVADVEKNAAYLETLLQKRGFTTRQLAAAPGTPPTVYAERKFPGAKRTVLFYAHYDGQPINQKGWVTEPFKPTMRSGPLGPDIKDIDWKAAPTPLNPDWRLYARSTGDDKASIQAMLTALDALKAKGMQPAVNIKLFYEGEEEQGSPHLAEIMAKNKELLKSDLIVMGDGPVHQSGRQMIHFGNRGVLGVGLTVFGPLHPLHDGHYGSWAPSPSVEIANLLAKLRADNGDILIPGIYDDVKAPTATEKAALAALPPVEGDLLKALGLGAAITDQRLADSYFRPTLNIRSIHVGDQGPHAANAIATSAFASLDFRLVPGETPAHIKELFNAYLASLGWTITDKEPDLAMRQSHAKIVQVTWDAGSSIATKTDLDAPAALAATKAIEKVEGGPILREPMVGASSGLAEIVAALGVPMAGVSIANYDDNQHAENENLRLGNLWDGIAVYAGLLTEMTW